MTDFARIFDLPVDSAEHQMLTQTAWMGGSFITVPYFLGRLLNQNLFREEQGAVAGRLRQYFLDRGWTESAPLAANITGWDILGSLLENYVQPRLKTGESRRGFLAIEAFLMNPRLSNAEIASQLGTTEKQIVRCSEVNYLRRLLAESISENPPSQHQDD